VNPFFLGTAERRIFGLYEPAAPTSARVRAAVLCYPWGTEYVCSHRSMRYLAARLAKIGYHTLRFDYFGTGDSGGDESQTDAAGMESDVESAIESASEIAGTSQVALIGLRVGANIAARVAARVPGRVEALVLWDPIVSSDDSVPRQALPPRSLVLVTQRPQPAEALRRMEAGSLRVEIVEAPCPWIESATITGVLPVRPVQRIEEWLR
jgi:pimeloyl-ACP methyl ester carboxylesterase